MRGKRLTQSSFANQESDQEPNRKCEKYMNGQFTEKETQWLLHEKMQSFLV